MLETEIGFGFRTVRGFDKMWSAHISDSLSLHKWEYLNTELRKKKEERGDRNTKWVLEA